MRTLIELICVLVVFSLVVVGMALVVKNNDCSNYGEMKSVKTETRFLVCYVTTNDGQVFTKEEHQYRSVLYKPTSNTN